MTYQVMKAPVLSTAHISMESNERLLSEANQVDLVIRMPYGFLIFVGDGEDGGMFDHYPQDVQDCARWCIEQGYTWLRLDSIGDEVPGLPTYEWD